MTLEELLSDQGSAPLSNKVNGAPLRANINAAFKRAGVPVIDATTPSDQILEAIYGLEDDIVRDKLLSKGVTEVKSVLNFKRVMSVTAIVLTLALLLGFVRVVKGGDPLTAEEIDMIKTIGLGAFDMVKTLFGNTVTQ